MSIVILGRKQVLHTLAHRFCIEIWPVVQLLLASCGQNNRQTLTKDFRTLSDEIVLYEAVVGICDGWRNGMICQGQDIGNRCKTKLSRNAWAGQY
jgi:hypothetical protein